MARPKKNQVPLETNPIEPLTEQVLAPVTIATVVEPPVYAPPPPRQMRVERQGSRSEPYTRRFPQIRGGICEFCGVLDHNVPSIYQYKMCPHYRGMEARCTYCAETKDPDEVVRISDMNVAEHPDNPNTLIMWCNSYECSKAHNTRFKRAS